MKSLNEVLSTLKRENKRLQERYNVVNIEVFGSVSRGEAT